MGPNPGVDFCGVHVAEVVALGFAPVPPQRTSESEQGEEGCGDKALEAKNFLARAAAAAVAAGSEGAASSAAAPVVSDGVQLQKERENVVTGKKKGRDWRDRGRRIPCPHDPHHSIYEKELQHHLNHCPMYKQMQAMKAQPFYSENINLGAGSAGLVVVEEEDVEVVEAEEDRLRQGEVHVVQPKFKALLADLQAGVDMRAFATLVHQVYDKVIGSIPTEELLPSRLAGVEAQGDSSVQVANSPGGRGVGGIGSGMLEGVGGKGEGVGRRMWNSQRHEEQQRSIVGHMEKRGLLQPEYVYVEMGAGRGTLSRTLNNK